MNNYEIMLILSPTVSQDDLKKSLEDYKKLITSNGGRIVHDEIWGLRQLAFQIKGKSTGNYFLVEFEAAGDVNANLETQLKRDDSVVRWMITRLDKYAVQYNERRREKKKAREEEKAAARQQA